MSHHAANFPGKQWRKTTHPTRDVAGRDFGRRRFSGDWRFFAVEGKELATGKRGELPLYDLEFFHAIVHAERARPDMVGDIT